MIFPENKVRINAFIYDGEKTKKLGGISSNGRNLPRGLYLKFIAQTNVRDNFRYYWQIVNTGEEEKKANDLIGRIFDGNQIRWEHTKYQGKHWVECFIVQNDTCIARSGKFFVNIK